jgi:hypothetical protein
MFWKLRAHFMNFCFLFHLCRFALCCGKIEFLLSVIDGHAFETVFELGW